MPDQKQQQQVQKPKKFDYVRIRKENPELLASIIEALQSPGVVVLFNRLSRQFEVFYDGVPYVFPGHTLRSVPVEIARHCVTKGEVTFSSEDGEEEIIDWILVPPNYDTFCLPFDEKVEDRIVNPINYLDLSQEGQYLPQEAQDGRASTWVRRKIRPQKPRHNVRPIITSGPISVSFSAVGGGGGV